MSEELDQAYLAEHPKATTDPKKAEYEAYGEKPFRDDAHDIGKMIVRANVLAEHEDTDDTFDVYGGPVHEHAYKLQNSKEAAVWAAEAAGESAGRAYDTAKKAHEELEALTSSHV